MTTDYAAVRARLAEKSVAGSYRPFLLAGAVFAIAGIAVFAVALMGGDSHRAWQAFHVNWLFWTSLTGGSLAITAVHKIANAKWSGVILRFSQAAIAMAPISIIGLILILTVGYHDIFGHMQEQLHSMSHGKQLWLSRTWMSVRLLGGLSLLYYLGYRLVRIDVLHDLEEARQHVDGPRAARWDRMLRHFDAPRDHASTYRLAPMFAWTYAMVFTMVAFDGIMALQPHWFSNLLGGWFFMGAFLGAHMLLALLMIYGNKVLGLGEYISPKQRHDLGKLCFGFTVFWTYLMWAQYLVIWYGNLPEETGFVFSRLWGPWRQVGTAVGLGMFVVPFAGLLGVGPKKTPLTLGIFASVSLCALWLERYLMVLPSVTTEPGPVFGLAEAGPTVAFVGLFLVCYYAFTKAFPMVSPRLAMITLEKEHGHH